MRQILMLSLLMGALVGLAGAQGTGKGQTDAEIEKEILKLENERDEARQKGDMKALDRISPTIISISECAETFAPKPIALMTTRPESLRFTPSRRTIFSSRFTETRF